MASDELVAEIASVVRQRWFPDADETADDEGLFVDMARTAVEAIEARGHRAEHEVLTRLADHLDVMIRIGGSPELDSRLDVLTRWLRRLIARGESLFRDNAAGGAR